MIRPPILILPLAFWSAVVFSADVDFVRDIRPILSENCFFCHGPDADRREADLRLDTAEGAADAIIASDSDASELFNRLITDDEDTRMPPPDSHREITDAQIELIRQWIDQGAAWEQHWSFRPIERPPVPRPAGYTGVPIRNPIDAFVQHSLAETRLRPAEEADRRTLIRRLSLDLTGLPPRPDDVNHFLNDASEGAYQKVVDRLLESPAYGERMTWDWLDAARYADTNGYQGDNERTMWPWRDWVIDSFNSNLPYDQFTSWQIAGDLLRQDDGQGPTENQILATGFFRNHMINGEGGRIAEENRVEYVMDMAETMGTVWLGLTLNCCRCHDHKYDPLTNEDYYQLYAFFNQTPVVGNGGNAQTAPVLARPTQKQQQQLDHLSERQAELDADMIAVAKQHADGQDPWSESMRQQVKDDASWQVLSPKEMFASGAALRKLGNESILASGKNPDQDTYTIVAPTKLDQITGLRLEALQHGSLTGDGLSRSASGNFVLTSVEVSIVDGSDTISIPIDSATASFEQDNHEITKSFDGIKKTGWAVYEDGRVDKPHTAVFRFGQSVDVPVDAEIRVILRHESDHQKHNLGCFRLGVTGDDKPDLPKIDDELHAALMTDADDRNGKQIKAIAKAYRESIPEYAALQVERGAVNKRRSAVTSRVPQVMVMAEQEERRETFVLQRGLYNKPADQVDAAIPTFLSTNVSDVRQDASDATHTVASPADRSTLANWLVSDENPLTARVTVNRLWQQLFGIGLVKTSEDFGAQGEIPIQMDLLNWLAAEFRDSGWDVKHLVRTITASHTYRQSSKVTDPDTYEIDPGNRYLARGARFRMPSWMIRDQALQASGLLSKQLGGEPVNTYQPAGVWEEASFGKKSYVRDDGEKLYRRSLYIFWRRIVAPTMLFDSASRQTCSVKVSRTNTPLHALQTLNDVTYVEAARALAERVLTMKEFSSDRQRLDDVMKRVVARGATDAEAVVLLQGLKRARRQYQSATGAADKLLALGESKRDTEIDAIDHASWTGLCLTILNLDETLTRE